MSLYQEQAVFWIVIFLWLIELNGFMNRQLRGGHFFFLYLGFMYLGGHFFLCVLNDGFLYYIGIELERISYSSISLHSIQRVGTVVCFE